MTMIGTKGGRFSDTMSCPMLGFGTDFLSGLNPVPYTIHRHVAICLSGDQSLKCVLPFLHTEPTEHASRSVHVVSAVISCACEHSV